MSLTALLIHSIESLGLKDTLFGKGRRNGETKKLLLAMKLTAFILISACMIASAKGNTQGVTLSVKNAPLETVFKELKKQTGYQFLYNNQMLDGSKKVSINISNGTIEQVLEICFKDQALTYTIVDKTIIVKEKEKTPNEEANLRNEPPPPIDVTGKVTDADGNPLSGATVKVKGTSKGTTTGNDGVFVLKGIDENATLEISFVGYETYTVAVANKTTIVASLKIKPESLNEVVINKGYYTEKQKYSVSNVGRVTSKDIEKQPVNNPILAMEGRVPGLYINQNTGVPGGGVTVRIQGQNSIGNGNEPFYVIDGVPYYSSLPPAGPDGVLGSSGATALGNVAGGNPLSYINPLDIESIEVLKDADATAIYGSRAANGAILITTKKGKVGKTKVDFNVQQGWGKATRLNEMMNRRQYLDMRYEALKNDGIDINTVSPTNSKYYDLKVWDTTRYTDWQKVLIGGTAKFLNINSVISGGTQIVQYRVGAKYSRETTVFPGNFSDQKASLHFNITSLSTNQRFRFQLTGSYLMDDDELPASDLSMQANLLEPVAPSIYLSDGNLNWAPASNGTSTWINPFIYLSQIYNNKTNNLISNTVLGYTVLPGLELKASAGYSYLQTNDFAAVPLLTYKPEDRPYVSRSADYGNRLMRSWIIEPQLNYSKNMKKARIEALVGTTFQQNNGTSGSIHGEGYTNDQVLSDIKAATTLTASNSTVAEYKYNAVYGRINYNWDQRYIVNINGRRDGSSRFGDKNKFHDFASVGFAWLFSEESFLRKSLNFLSLGKIRMSYGTTGNDQIGDYSFISRYNVINAGVPYQNTTGLVTAGLSNPYLQWEETKKLQAGLDLGFLSDRIVLNTTYVRNRSSNQLLKYNLPTVTGFLSISQNFPATVENTSWELSLNTVNIKFPFNWTSSINLTVPHNKLVSFPNLEQSTYAAQLIIGLPLGIGRYYSFMGVNPSTGQYIVADQHGNATSSPNSNTDINTFISLSPKIYGGFQNTIAYKGFELDFLLQYVNQKGNYIFYNNGTAVAPGVFLSGNSNQPISVLDRWQKQGDHSKTMQYTTNFGNSIYPLSLAQNSDASVADASFVRLKNLSFTWTLPGQWQRKAKMQSAKIYVQGQNLFTITPYKGADPENQGYSSLPPLRMIAMGVQVGF